MYKLKEFLKGMWKRASKLRSSLDRYKKLKILYPRLYKKYAKKPLRENKIVFVEPRISGLKNSFEVIFDELAGKYDFRIHVHFLRENFVSPEENEQRIRDLIKDMATAKYIFLDEASKYISCVKMRPETKVIQLWHGCGAFKRFGYGTTEGIFGPSKDSLDLFPMYKNFSCVTVSSPEVEWAYVESMGLQKTPDVVMPLGVSRTDLFYKKQFIDDAYKKLHYLMPSSAGKKVILYAPTFRGRVAKANMPEMISIKMFERELSDDYVLIIKHHPLVRNKFPIPEQYSGFAADFTNSMSIEELICVSDICISDYSSLVFEYALFERPMIFFAFDLDEYFDWRGFYYDYHELAPGPVMTTNAEMIDYIKNIQTRFDKNKVKAFREKFMSSCDGHATERIMEFAFGERELLKHKKQNPQPDSYHLMPNADILYGDSYKRIKRLIRFKKEYPSLYKKKCVGGITPKSTVLLYDKTLPSIFRSIEALISTEQNMTCCRINIDALDAENDFDKIANAEFIIIYGRNDLINVLDIRAETTVIEIPEIVFPFEKFDYASKRVRGGLEKDYLDVAPLHKNYGMVTVASNELSQIFCESFGVSNPAVMVDIGDPKTDLFFNAKFIKRSREKLIKAVPEAKNKKIIYYMPQPRRALTSKSEAMFFDTKMMYEYLSRDYIVVYTYDVYHEDEAPKILKYYGKFIFNLTNVMSPAELMSVADVMIGDYTEEIFTFAVTKRPLFLYAPDHATLLYGRDLNFDYFENAPGEVYSDTEEMAKAVADLKSYDFTKLNAFCNKYFRLCDGNATARLVRYLSEK